MNKLPEGWKEVELGDVLDYEQPTDYIVSSTDYDDSYKTPVLTAGKSFILGYTNETEGIYTKPPVIIFDDFTTDTKYVDFKFKVKSSAMKMLTPKDKSIDLKFIFLLMQTIKRDATTHKRYYISVYSKIKIPLPPISIQKKIVAKLEMAEKMKWKRSESDKLTKEYLQSIFYDMFGDPFNQSNKNSKKLCEVAEITMGQSPPGETYNENGVGMPFFQGKTEFGDKYTVVRKWTTQPTKKALKGDILMSVRAPVGSVNISSYDCCIGRGLASIKCTKISREYLFDYLRIIEEQIANLGAGSTFDAITAKQVNDLPIIVPSDKLQQKFAKELTKIDKIKDKQRQSKVHIDGLFDSLMQKAFKGELM